PAGSRAGEAITLVLKDRNRTSSRGDLLVDAQASATCRKPRRRSHYPCAERSKSDIKSRRPAG
ncbi:hypothetical protein CQA89_33390, partial [Klebsiella pneumoniae]